MQRFTVFRIKRICHVQRYRPKDVCHSVTDIAKCEDFDVTIVYYIRGEGDKSRMRVG